MTEIDPEDPEDAAADRMQAEGDAREQADLAQGIVRLWPEDAETDLF